MSEQQTDPETKKMLDAVERMRQKAASCTGIGYTSSASRAPVMPAKEDLAPFYHERLQQASLLEVVAAVYGKELLDNDKAWQDAVNHRRQIKVLG